MFWTEVFLCRLSNLVLDNIVLKRRDVRGAYKWLKHVVRINKECGVRRILFFDRFPQEDQSYDDKYTQASPKCPEGRYIGFEVICKFFNKFVAFLF